MKIKINNKIIEQKVINFIKENNLIEADDRILVALSGGSDSVFLINFFHKYKKKFKILLGAFHLNHLLRDESSVDQKFSENICSSLSIPFFTANKNVKLFAKKNKVSIEEAGRNLRYELMNKFAKKNNFNKIATAHNLNDNSETVLLNLIKGKGLRAISGIPIKIGNIIRPILCLTKSEIEEYLKFNNILFIDDKSNYDIDYQRNYLRIKIVPELKKINQNFDRTIFQTSKIIRDYLDFTESSIKNKISQLVDYDDGDIMLNLDKFSAESNFIKSEIVRGILIQFLHIEPNFKNIEQVLKLINNQVGRKISISDNYNVFKERNNLIFTKNYKSQEITTKIQLGHSYQIQNQIITINKVDNIDKINSNNEHKIEYIDAEKIIGDLYIRKWQYGDRFIPLGMKGSKKVSDFLTDLKIPSSKRKKIFLLVDEEKPVSVLGYRLDDRVKISQQSKKFIKIEIKNAEQ